MSVDNHVTLNITQDSAGLSRAGFGTPMIASNTATWPERSRTYTTLSAVGSDFATTSPEYLTTQATFSQNPHIPSVKIGRFALAATKVLTLQISTAVNARKYELTVRGEGLTTTTVSYTSDATATKPEISAGLKVVLDAVTGKNYAVVDDTVDTLTITGSAAGNWFAIGVSQANLVEIKAEETHVDPGVATDIAAIVGEDDDWYFLLTHFNSGPLVLACVADIEARRKVYLFDVVETDAITTVVGSVDTLDTIHTATRGRSAGVFHPWSWEFPCAAWIGDTAWMTPGAETWKFRVLSGITPVKLTATQRINLLARKANLYETVSGRNIMSEGTTADGDFIDIARFIDWLHDDMSKATFEVIADATEKVGYDDVDMARVEAAIWGSLRRGIQNRGLKENPEPTVNMSTVDDQSTANVAVRLWNGITFDAKLLGAVHKLGINGTVS